MEAVYTTLQGNRARHPAAGRPPPPGRTNRQPVQMKYICDAARPKTSGRPPPAVWRAVTREEGRDAGRDPGPGEQRLKYRGASASLWLFLAVRSLLFPAVSDAGADSESITCYGDRVVRRDDLFRPCRGQGRTVSKLEGLEQTIG